MKTPVGWCAPASLVLACAFACGGGNTHDDVDQPFAGAPGAAGESGAGGTGGAGLAGAGGVAGAGSGAGGADEGEGGAGGSSKAGAPTGESGGAADTTGGASGASGAAGASGSAGAPMTAPGFTEGAVLAPGVHISGDPKLVVNRAGDAVVAWPGSTGTRIGIWTLRHDPTTEIWGEPIALNVDDNYDAELHDLALDEDGNAYVAWKQGFIFVTRYDAATTSWTDAVQIEEHDDGGVGDPRIADGPNGTAAVVWPESDGSRTSLRTRRYDPVSDEWSYWEANRRPRLQPFEDRGAGDRRVGQRACGVSTKRRQRRRRWPAAATGLCPLRSHVSNESSQISERAAFVHGSREHPP